MYVNNVASLRISANTFATSQQKAHESQSKWDWNKCLSLKQKSLSQKVFYSANFFKQIWQLVRHLLPLNQLNFESVRKHMASQTAVNRISADNLLIEQKISLKVGYN